MKTALEKFEQYFTALILIAITFILFANVVLRFFGISLEWAEEVARYGIIWVTFIGGSICIYKGGHIRVDAIAFFLSDKGKKILQLIVIIFSFAFMLALIYQSSKLSFRALGTNQVSATLEIPMFFIYLAMPISGVLMTIRYIQSFVQTLKEIKELKEATE